MDRPINADEAIREFEEYLIPTAQTQNLEITHTRKRNLLIDKKLLIILSIVCAVSVLLIIVLIIFSTHN